MLDETNVVAPPIAPPIAPPVIPQPLPAQEGKSPLGPLLVGFFLVIVISALIAAAYYWTKFRPSASPSPTPTAIPSPIPSLIPSATPSATPKSSLKPTSAIKPTPSLFPSATPFSLPNLDLRFGNPSANVKQTVDEGKGDGRVIYREYSSIQAGQFDEVSASWSPKITVCYHLVSSEAVDGKLLKFTMTLDDKTEVEDNMGWLGNLEAGRIYDWCHDVTVGVGKHTARLTINADKSVKEANYGNDLASVTWENLADNVAPNFNLSGPFDWGVSGTCLLLESVSDNVSKLADLKIESRVDGGAWANFSETQYCFTGSSGSSHSFAVKVTDQRSNDSEQSKTFLLY